MSFGKIHRTFFGSSVNEADVVTRFIFIGMIVLSDWAGKIDVTRQALSRLVNVTIEEINRAIETLSQPEPSSRTTDYEGRRIIPIDPARSWGWVVVNKAQYRVGEADPDEERSAARERKRRQRERQKQSSSSLTNTSSKEEKTLTPGVTVTDGHGMSRKKRDMAFERAWALVPRKEGRIDARKHFDAHVRGLMNAADPDQAFERYVADLERAIRTYTAKEAAKGTEPRFYMQGSKLFRNFRDYVDWKEPAAADRRFVD